MQDGKTEDKAEGKPKRVIHLITKGSPFGGAQNYVYTLAASLPLSKYESIVLTGEGDDLSTRLEILGINVIRLLDLKSRSFRSACRTHHSSATNHLYWTRMGIE